MRSLQQGIVIFLMCALMAGCQPSGFELLLEHTFDSELKTKLEDYARDGVEQPWPGDFEKDQLVEAALKYKGVRYKSGGANRKGMDCSGLLFRAAKDIGLSLPHRSADIARYGRVIHTLGRLRKGDLVFFRGSSTRLITHSGIMISQDQFIHVSSSNGCIISTFDEYWKEYFLFGTR